MLSFVKKGGGKLRGRHSIRLSLRVLQALPVTLPAALAAFSLIAVAHLLLGQFRASLVVPLGLLAAAMAGYYAQRMSAEYLDEDRVAERKSFDIIVLVAVVLWLIVNLLFTSEHLFTNRDPATYNLAGIWLGNHQSIQIDKPASLKALEVPGLTAESLGFATNPANSNVLQAQGAHLLPALQALAYKVTGTQGVLRLNVLFGATALLAFYGFSRLIVRPRWAMLGVVVMGLSLPMLFLARDSYTEPLTMTFVFGGLSLLRHAEKACQRWQWWLAGFVLGAAALTRIDAYLIFAGVELAVVIRLLLAPKNEFKTLVGCVGWLAIGAFLSGYTAWLDVSVLSSAYYQAHQQFIVPELRLLVVITVVGTVTILLNRRYNIIANLGRHSERWRDKALWFFIGGFFIILASRPLWYVGYQRVASGAHVRTFSEHTLNWIIWYIGPVLMAAGVAGLAVVVTRMGRGREKHFLPLVATIAVTGVLYLLQPNITGDQVWATRRLLPIVIPGFVLLGMWIYEMLFEKKYLQFRGRTYNLELIVTVLATVSVLSPLFVTYPFTFRRLYVPELAQMRSICAREPRSTVIIWVGEARLFAVQPTRTICGNDSLGLPLAGDTKAINQTQLAELARHAQDHHLHVVIGFFGQESASLPVDKPVKAMLVSSISYHEIEHTYKRAPRNVITLDRSVFMGKLTPSGLVVPLSSASK